MTAAFALTLALLQATAAAPAPAQGTAPAPQPARRPAATSLTLQVRVTDRTGTPVEGVAVTLEGPASREGKSDASGSVQFRTLAAGTYRIRAEGDTFITLEKEVTVRAGATVPPVEFALSFAPPPPPPPPAPEPPKPEVAAAPAPKAGSPRVLSIADLAEKSLGGREPSKFVPVACSGLDNTQMLVLRESLKVPAKADADTTLYVVAGEATLNMNGRDQTMSSGWYAMVPRGTAHALTKRGRNPAVLLVTTGGSSCDAAEGH
ncbi:MAG: carboxypeptidase regulatory-like domain-containing protein [Acidobacteria bacterium]|nr:carboxypeptidase regulatory-like domain-containing protein [Acidobacteriota bacterium]